MDDLFMRIMRTQSVSRNVKAMNQLILTLMQERGIKAELSENQNIYVTKGEAEVYPAIIAHTDTVHDLIPEKAYSIHNANGVWFAYDNIEGRLTGIGGDDKVGIYLAIRLMDALPAVKLAFFRDEEIGCQGSRVADLDFFTNCAFVLQADRRGYGDFVNEAGGVELHGNEFATAVAPILDKYIFKPSYGALTDVMALKERGMPIAAANMSCGYYDPHMHSEHIRELEVRYTYQMMLEICQTMAHRRWEHITPKRWAPRQPSRISGTQAGNGTSHNRWSWEDGCFCCGATRQLFFSETYHELICRDCFREITSGNLSKEEIGLWRGTSSDDGPEENAISLWNAAYWDEDRGQIVCDVEDVEYEYDPDNHVWKSVIIRSDPTEPTVTAATIALPAKTQSRKARKAGNRSFAKTSA